jgi:type VI protein secretion system component VasA
VDPEAAARAELPELTVSFVGAWEAELAAHHKTMAVAQTATNRALAAQRVAAAVLADAEAEMAAAAERHKVTEEQLGASINAIIGV